MNWGWPPEAVPAAPGSCTLWVASNTTGQPKLAHDRQAAHVDHQIVVAERSAALGEQNLVVAGGGDLLGGVLDIVRRDELALLDVHDAAGASGVDQQIGLAAEERGDLQNVDGLGGELGLRGLVNVGEHGDAAIAHALQDAQAFFEAGAAIGADAGAVGFVEGRFEDEGAGDLADFARPGNGRALRFR